MPMVNFDVAPDVAPLLPRSETPDIGNAFLNAFKAADQRTYERERQAKQDAIAADERTYQRGREAKQDAWTEQQNARTQKGWAATDAAGAKIAAGDTSGAADELYKAGNIDGGIVLEEKHRAHLEKTLAMAQALTPLAAGAQSPEEFNHFLDVAEQRGVDVSKFRGGDWQQMQRRFLVEHNYETQKLERQAKLLSYRKTEAEALKAEKEGRSQNIAVNEQTGEYYSKDTGPLNQGAAGAGKPPSSPHQAMFARKYAENEAPKAYTAASTAFADAREASSALNDMAALAPHVKTGFGAEQRLTLQKFGNWLGVQVDPSVANTETFLALSQKAVINLAGKLKPLSNSDIQFVQKAVASVQNDPATFMMLIPQLQAVAARSQLAAQYEMEYLRQGLPPDPVRIAEEVERQIPSPIQESMRGPAPGPAGPSAQGAPQPQAPRPMAPRGAPVPAQGANPRAPGYQPGFQAPPAAPPENNFNPRAPGYVPPPESAAPPGFKYIGPAQ